MKNLMILFAMMIVVGCANGETGSQVVTAPAVTADPKQPSETARIPFCYELVKCSQQCASFFPYEDEKAIKAACAARGMLNSGACIKQLERNQDMIDQYQACLASTADKVISYP